jgi:hypothetical protein
VESNREINCIINCCAYEAGFLCGYNIPWWEKRVERRKRRRFKFKANLNLLLTPKV